MTQDPRPSAGRLPSIDRRIATLAFPALGALVAEPLFLAVDSALIGHLGAVPLAGLAIASAILSTAIGLMIFLAYSTTPLVARLRGAGDVRGAIRAGIDGLWLALGIGMIVGLVLGVARSPLVAVFGADAGVAEQAKIFLGISALGVPAMLVVFAATGLLRGLLDTVTPLAVAAVGFTVNALLNWLFIYGFGWGIAGSAWGTVTAQWGMVVVYLIVIVRHARREGASLRPARAGLNHAGRSGWWVFLRTLGLRVALVATVGAAAAHGAAAIAGYQIVFILVSITAFGLDALAIAAQALVGDALGARDADRARTVLRRTIFWGLITGVLFGGLLAALSPWLGRIFTDDERVLALLPGPILIVGVTLPLAAVVYVLDGVLLGAGDTRYLALVSLATLIIYLPALWLTTILVPSGRPALIAITAAFTFLLMLLRAVTLTVRAWGDRWVRLGAQLS